MDQYTLAIIKCSALHNAVAILKRASNVGLDPVPGTEAVPRHMSPDQASMLYREHEGRPYYDDLIKSVIDGPTVVAVLKGQNAIARWRHLLGPTDPEKAPPGTIRGDFGQVMPHNAAHGSDSEESAKREIAIFFPNPPLESPLRRWLAT